MIKLITKNHLNYANVKADSVRFVRKTSLTKMTWTDYKTRLYPFVQALNEQCADSEKCRIRLVIGPR